MSTLKLKPHKTGNLNGIKEPLPDLATLHPTDGTRKEISAENKDYSKDDLSIYDISDFSFDDKTIWPTDPQKLPQGFEQKDKIMELGKNPGLGVRSLHARGIDGTGMRMAIIDQALSDHAEYHDNLVHYEEWGDVDKNGQMHGSAVSSIAVGKTVGVAPKAKLYYFADKHSRKDSKTGKTMFFTDNCVKALERIIEINETLPPNEKIQVVSMSWGGQADETTQGCDKWFATLEKAKKAGLFVLTTSSRREYALDFSGAGRGALGDPEHSWNKQAYWVNHQRIQELLARANPRIIVPMDDRTTASHYGKNEYVHYLQGGMSWATPWLAGMFVLARQVDPTVTPEHFWEVATKTGILSKEVGGSIIQPVKLIETLEKEQANTLKHEQNKSPKKKGLATKLKEICTQRTRKTTQQTKTL